MPSHGSGLLYPFPEPEDRTVVCPECYQSITLTRRGTGWPGRWHVAGDMRWSGPQDTHEVEIAETLDGSISPFVTRCRARFASRYPELEPAPEAKP